jgi:hypothetical protein
MVATSKAEPNCGKSGSRDRYSYFRLILLWFIRSIVIRGQINRERISLCVGTVSTNHLFVIKTWEIPECNPVHMKRLLVIVGSLMILAGLGAAGLWFSSMSGSGHLEWENPDVKKTVMTFAYKVYGNRKLELGRYYLAKLLFKNTGNQPVRDFSVSYQIPGYVDWTTPESIQEIPPGHDYIARFYPDLPAKVTGIKNRTNAMVEARVRWNDGSGSREEILRQDFMFRGVNEIEYTDVKRDDLVTWFDLFTNSDLLAAMVTPNDPVVEEFAAAITEKTGGAVAGAGGVKEAIEVMRGTYDYMLQTGMRYAGSQGFPEQIGDTTTTVQTVRMPRDVIITNNGLCVELAILWSSILEHLGIRSYLFLVPGHAFVLVQSEGNIIPIECTAITPKSVGGNAPISFDQAVQFATKEIQQAQSRGLLKVIDVQTLQSNGIIPPELPDIAIGQIKEVLASRGKTGPRPSQPMVEQAAAPQQQAAGIMPANMSEYATPNGALHCYFPQNWNSAAANDARLPQLIFTAADRSGSTLEMEAYYTPAITEPGASLQSIIDTLSRYGLRARVADQKRLDNGVLMVSGSSYSRRTGAATYWLGAFRPHPQGAVGVVFGSTEKTFKYNKDTILKLMSGVQFP